MHVFQVQVRVISHCPFITKPQLLELQILVWIFSWH